MTSSKIPAELYYLEPSFSLRSARKFQLLDILDSNGVVVPDTLTRIDLIKVFKRQILPRKDEIIREYNRKKIEEYLRTDTEGEEDSEELSEEDNLSELAEEELQEQNDRYGHERTIKQEDYTTPDKLYPVLDNGGLSSEIPQDDSTFQTPPPTHSSHRWTLRNRNRRHHSDESSEDDEDYIPEFDEEVSDSEEEEEDLGDIGKEELVMLYKDQYKPPETYDRPKFHMMTRAQKAAYVKEQSLLWKQRMSRLAYFLVFAYLSIGSVVISITTYRRNKNGYCQNYPVALESNDTGVFHWPSSCIPCPDHGICKNGELICEALYERKTPFYNIGRMFPIADECVHNSVLGKYVGRVERNIKEKLAIHQGDMVCEYLIAHPEYTDELPVAKLPAKTLLEQIRIEERDYLPEDRVDEIMLLALTTVIEDPKVHNNEVDGERYIGIEKPKFTLGCRLKRLYHSLSFKSKLSLLALVTFILSMYGTFTDFKRNQVYKKKIDKLVKATINTLKNQAHEHARDRSISPAISVPQLRSRIVDVNNQQTIHDWQQVLRQIQTNPHIRKSFQEVRGDPVEFWELTT